MRGITHLPRHRMPARQAGRPCLQCSRWMPDASDTSDASGVKHPPARQAFCVWVEVHPGRNTLGASRICIKGDQTRSPASESESWQSHKELLVKYSKIA